MVSLHELIDKEFGVRTRSAPNREATVMTTTSQLVLRNDSSRLAALIINLGGVAVFIRPSGRPSATVGIRISPNGGFFSVLWNEDFALVGEEWNGVSATVTSTLFVLETLIEPGGGG